MTEEISKELAEALKDRFTIVATVDGKIHRFKCGTYAVLIDKPEPASWAFPVGNSEFPPEKWYAASMHSPDGSLNNGYKHTGYDLNLDMFERGDVERRLGLGVYAVSEGDVTYITDDWNGVPMLVMVIEHAGSWLWVRYGHIVPGVAVGSHVQAGQLLGTFADWHRGDHLHFDMCTEAITKEWISGPGTWLDPYLVLQLYLDPVILKKMITKGD